MSINNSVFLLIFSAVKNEENINSECIHNFYNFFTTKKDKFLENSNFCLFLLSEKSVFCSYKKFEKAKTCLKNYRCIKQYCLTIVLLNSRR